MYFPEMFHNVLNTAYWSKMKEQTMKMCDQIITGKSFENEIEAANRYYSMLIKPKSFSGKDNAELRYDKDFEKNCILLSSLANKPVKECTTKEYFALIQHHNDNGRKSNKENRHN